VDRLLGMRLALINPKLSRQVSFEFMNQQLVWHGLSEFLMFLMPLLNLPALKQTIARGFRWIVRQTIGSDSDAAVSGGADGMAAPGAGSMQVGGCPVCQTEPITRPVCCSCPIHLRFVMC
jgi:peroxin-2